MSVFNYAVSRVSNLPKGGTQEQLRAEVITLKHAFEIANTIVTEAGTVEVLIKPRDHKGRIDPAVLPFVVRSNEPRWTAPPQTRGPVAPKLLGWGTPEQRARIRKERAYVPRRLAAEARVKRNVLATQGNAK